MNASPLCVVIGIAGAHDYLSKLWKMWLSSYRVEQAQHDEDVHGRIPLGNDEVLEGTKLVNRFLFLFFTNFYFSSEHPPPCARTRLPQGQRDWRMIYSTLPQKSSTYRGRILLSREIREELPPGKREVRTCPPKQTYDGIQEFLVRSSLCFLCAVNTVCRVWQVTCPHLQHFKGCWWMELLES